MSDPGTPAPAAPPAPAPAAAPPAAWYNGADAETTSYITTRGLDKLTPDKAALEAINAHRNSEKLLGVPADQVLKLPKADAPDAEWGAVYDRLGRPKEAKAYEIKVEGADDTFLGTAKDWFYEAGVPQKAAQKLAEKYQAYGKAAREKQAADGAAQVAQETASLKAEWGDGYDKNVARGKMAAMQFGVDAKTIDAMQNMMGFAKVLKFFDSVGAKMGVEGKFTSGESRGADFGMTAEQARTEIKTLTSDKNFAQKFGAGDADARAKIAKLHKIAAAG